MEMYDFMIFGYYATAVAHTFFPRGNEFASLMLSLSTFGAGFLMRPVGAVLLGSYVDRRGRRSGLLLTLSLMGIGSVIIACLPGYAVLGIFAPLLVLFARLLQGLSAGVEVGGVSVYLAEIATPGNKGFFVAWQSASQQLAVVFAAAVGIGLTSTFSPRAIDQWGWRVPLWIGCAILPFLLLIRRSLEETEEFLRRPHRPSSSEVLRRLLENWNLVGLGVLLATMTTVCFYLITVYTPTFGGTVLHLGGRDNFIVTLCVGISNFVLLPIMGSVSDRLGRRPVLIACGVMALVSAYPALLWLTAAPSFSRLLAVELWLSFIYSGYNGAMVVFLSEIMPAQVRTSAFSLAYSGATAIFGGFTPAVCTYLIHATGNPAAPAIWVSAAAICGLVASVALSPRRVARLESGFATATSS